MSSDIMCNGHRFVKSTLFQSPGYLADLSPYINAVVSSRLLAKPIELTASAIKPLAPLAHSILPTRATNFILSGTLTCEYCLHQVSQNSFDDGRPCPSLLLDKFQLSQGEFILADELLDAQERYSLFKRNTQSKDQTFGSNQVDSNHSLSPHPESSKTKSNITSNSDISSTSSQQQDQVATATPKLNASYESTRQINTIKPDQCHRYKDELLIMQICPEIGLHAQSFACVDCDKPIDLNTSRLCNYDGRYYCYQCHSGSDYLPIPARVLRNWDFTPKTVSKTSLQKICHLRTKPVLFNLFQINSMLYGFIDRLVEIKQIRERIQSMLKYLEVCGQPDKPYLIPVPKHFLKAELLNFFTLNDLFDIDQVHDALSQLQTTLETHIVRKCESCRGKGFYCELCKDPRDILYPFSKNGAACSKCGTVYHKNCFHRKKKNCPRCVRLSTKRSSLSTMESNNSLNLSEADEDCTRE